MTPDSRASGMIYCGHRARSAFSGKHGCSWRGLGRAHCGGERGCHITFGSVNSFDRHRKGGLCLNPAEIGFIEQQGNGFTYWGPGALTWGSVATLTE